MKTRCLLSACNSHPYDMFLKFRLKILLSDLNPRNNFKNLKVSYFFLKLDGTKPFEPRFFFFPLRAIYKFVLHSAVRQCSSQCEVNQEAS